MSEDLDHIFTGDVQPEPRLDLPTIYSFRRRILGMIFAREVAIRQLEVPSFTIEQPTTDHELMEATRELEQLRKSHRDDRLRRDGEFEALWRVSDLVDEMENDAIRQLETGD